jgi:hypothetical protein
MCLATYLYLWNDEACETADIIGTQETVDQSTRKLESHLNKLHVDKFFSLRNLFNDLTIRKSTAAGET